MSFQRAQQRMRRALRCCLVFFVLAILGPACRGEDAPGEVAPRFVGSGDGGPILDPPSAVLSLVDELRADLEAPRHPSDGRGRAFLVDPSGARNEAGDCPTVALGRPADFRVHFEAGAEGVALGGYVFFMPEPYWGWSPPHARFPEAPGFTTVETDADGVDLVVDELGTGESGLLRVRIDGRALDAGEQLVFHYGAGGAGVRVDRYAERGARLWVAVDGDGDGVRAVLPESPCVDVAAGPASRIVATLTSTVRPGGSARLTVAALDGPGNAAVDFVGKVALMSNVDESVLQLPASLDFSVADRGARSIEIPVLAASPEPVRVTARVLASVADGLDGGDARVEPDDASDGDFIALSNPMLVGADVERVLWADLHGHSNYSDGTGLPEDYYRYARDVAALDAVALTDHDHFGVLFLDQHPKMWADIRQQVLAFHEPERFVALLGYEWTSWIHGHRHVLWFDDEDEGEVFSSMDPNTETPAQLWDALRGRKALTYAHHSAGAPVRTNWSFPPDPELEPLAEVMSVHGSSEAADSPATVRGATPGYFVRDALQRGYRLGFVGSGDGHDGHPGLAHLAPTYGYQRSPAGTGLERLGTGGLAAIRSESLTRAGILGAMKARNVYATSGPRILMSAHLGGHRGGAAVPAAKIGKSAEFSGKVYATAPAVRVDVIRSGVVVRSVPLAGLDVRFSVELTGLASGDYVYARFLQDDGGLAWTSPIFVE